MLRLKTSFARVEGQLLKNSATLQEADQDPQIELSKLVGFDEHCQWGDETNECVRLEFPSGVYTGQVEQHQCHGWGRMDFSNDELYVGEWELNKRHGRGRSFHNNSLSYQGEWRNDTVEGVGSLHMPDGSRYDGQFVSNQVGLLSFCWPSFIVIGGESVIDSSDCCRNMVLEQ